MSASGASNGYTAELKFLVNDALGLRIRDWARERLAADPHGRGSHADEYVVSTIYLDTAARDVYHRRGSFGRSKYRVRRYGDEQRVFLERKLRSGSRLAKRRSDIDLSALAHLLDDTDPATRWFRRRLAVRRLDPVCRVTYSRIARTGMTADGPARLTLDCALAGAPVDAFTFAGAELQPLLQGQMILELKYRGAIPAIFRQLADTFALRPQRSSKYRLAARTLGLVETDPSQDTRRILHA